MENNTVYKFTNECCEGGRNTLTHKTESWAMYGAYRRWCRFKFQMPLSEAEFSDFLQKFYPLGDAPGGKKEFLGIKIWAII